jgi:hypothetical protein
LTQAFVVLGSCGFGDLRDDSVQVLDAALQDVGELRVESATVVQPRKNAAGSVRVEQHHVCSPELDASQAGWERGMTVFVPETACVLHLLR